MSKINFEQKIKYYSLFTFYKQLLTKRQQFYFDLYINNDLSFEEMAQTAKVSRNAIFDSINKTINLLENYEKKLQLYDKYQKRSKIYQAHLDLDFVQEMKDIDKL